MRRLLRIIDAVVPIVGVLIVLGAVLFVLQLRVQVALVVVGLLLVQVGVWKVASQMLPDERRFTALRREVDSFIDLVRLLNRAALALRADESVRTRQEFDAVRSALHDAVDQMVAVAGKDEAEVVTERHLQPWS